MNDTKIGKKSRGRPKTFDRDEAIKQAMKMFCEYGYQGTSMADLSKAMGMNAPSIYNAFGSKEELFTHVLDAYHTPFENTLRELFDGPKSVQDAFETLFNMLKEQHVCERALGCLIANSGVMLTGKESIISDKVKTLHNLNEQLYFKRLKRAQKEKEISANIDISKLARYVNGIVLGAATMARGQQTPNSVKDFLDQGFNGFLKLLS
jgi:AcrR family transcriptional regulator